VKKEDKPKDEEVEASNSENTKDEGPSKLGKKIETGDDKKYPIYYLFGRQPKSSSPKPWLKLDSKFDLPMYNGEINAEKLDNWIKQMEVYCSVQ